MRFVADDELGTILSKPARIRHQLSHTEEHADQLKGSMSKADVLLGRSGYIGTFCDECETSRKR